MAEELLNPCCDVFKEKFRKSEEKRSALRKAIKILESKLNNIQFENASITTLLEKEQGRVSAEIEAKAKETAARLEFENEIMNLRSKISSLQENVGSRGQNEDLLQTRISEREREINHLKKLLESERKRVESEKKKVEAEKKKTAEARKLMKAEKVKAKEQKKLEVVEKNKLEEFKLLEASKTEARAELISLKSKNGVAQKALEAEKQRADKEKEQADAEKFKADQQKKCAEEERKKAVNEICRSDQLSLQLEAEKLRNRKLQKEMEEKITSNRTAEMVHLAHSKEAKMRLVGVKRNKGDESNLSLEALEVEASQARPELVSLRSKNEMTQKDLEADKKRADREKKRADAKTAKADQQKKRTEEEGKEVVNEKHQSDQLFLQLEEERDKLPQKEMLEKMTSTMHLAHSEEAHVRLVVKQPKANRPDIEIAVNEKSEGYHFSEQLEKERQKNKELQKKIQEFMSANRLEKGDTVLSGFSIKASSADVRLLKEQLKLEKMHVKHAKKVAKLEKTRNNLLHQEVCRLKQDLFHFYHRLKVLDGSFSHSPEGNDASAKISNSFAPYDTNWKGNNSGGSCTKPSSGISSELESLLGGSDRNKSQTSAKYSTRTSFSDRTLVGSQERGDLAVTSSKFVEENSKNVQTISRLSEKITTLRYDKNLGVVAEYNVNGPAEKEMASARLVSYGHEENNVFGEVPVQARKKKRSRNTVESDGCMRRDNKLLKHMDRKLSVVQDMMLKSSLPSAIKSIAPKIGQREVPTLLDGLFVKNHESRKRKTTLQKEQLVLEQHTKVGTQKPSQNLGVEASDSANVCTQVVSNANQFPENIEAGEDTLVGAFRGSENSGVRFEDMGFEDFMKLLELDNPADEQRYTMAIEMPLSPSLPEINSPDLDMWLLNSCHDSVEGNVNGRLATLELDNPADKERYRTGIEMPLSPTLPEINSPNPESYEVDCSNDLLEGNVYGRLATIEDNLVNSCRFKSVDMEIDSSATDCRGPLMNICSDNSVEELNNKEDDFHIGTDEGRTCAHHVMEYAAATPVRKQTLCAKDGGSNYKIISNCCVVFSTMTGKSNVSRIIRATISCISEITMDSQTDWIAHKILLALATEQDLLPEERACVFVSLLLCNISVVTSVKLENYSIEDVYLGPESFAAHIQEVIAESEAKDRFVELIRMDVLVSLIQDFLIDRRVLSYNELCQESVFPCDSGSVVLVNGATISLSSKSATIDQLMVGSITLASICSAMGYIDFIREASYDIIRKHIPDSFFVLTMLHVFALVCGKQYFSSDSDSLIMTIIKSIVVLLERGHEMVDSECISDLSSASEGQPQFPHCSQCKFSEGVLPVDKALLLLLEKLHTYSLTGTKNLARGERRPGHEVCIHDNDIDFEGGLATVGLDSVVNQMTHHFDEIISLVELVSRFTSWRWICSEIIPQLLKMAESCVSEKVSAAIIILLGQLGRLGIDDSGSEQMGVEELRSSLSTFFSQTPTEKSNHPVQLSAVYSLIGLLKVEFVQIIQNKEDILIDKNGTGHYVNLIRRWFAQLNEEEKFSTLAFFEPEGILEI